MAEYEMADVLKNTSVYELAGKTVKNIPLTDEETYAKEQLDAYFKEVGRTGHDANHEVAAFLTKTINETIINAPSELLDGIFDRSTIGMYDDYEAYKLPPKNTLVAHEAAQGGNVERSYLDVTSLAHKDLNFQIETDISYAELERGGWKTVALFNEYALAAFENKLFAVLFDALDSAIVAGAENYIPVTGTMPDETTMRQVALYLQDRSDGSEGYIIGRSKYIQAISMFNTFVSQDMINEVQRNGRLGTYQGISLIPISSAKKLGDGSGLIMDKRLFGVAGKVGSLVTRGDVRVYQSEDNNKEKIHLMFKNFSFGYAFNDQSLENIIKVVLQ